MGEAARAAPAGCGSCPGRTAVPVALGQPDERALEPTMRGVEAVDRATRPETQVGGDLVVAGAAGVESPATGPMRSASADSRLRWTSSRAGPRRSGPRRCPRRVRAARRRARRPARRSAGPPGRARGRARSSPRCRRPPARVDVDRARERLDPRVVGLAEPPAPESASRLRAVARAMLAGPSVVPRHGDVARGSGALGSPASAVAATSARLTATLGLVGVAADLDGSPTTARQPLGGFLGRSGRAGSRRAARSRP